jgi:hypothetical protein
MPRETSVGALVDALKTLLPAVAVYVEPGKTMSGRFG